MRSCRVVARLFCVLGIAGSNMTEPFSLHMCGWTKDNCRCFWNSQTGCKIASRMQRERTKPSAFYIMKSLPPVCAASLREQARAQEVWPSFPEVPRIRKPACLSGGQRAAEPDSSPRFWLGFCPGPTAFLWAWQGWRQPGRVIFCPEVPRCPGWKGNQAVGLKPKATSHFSSLGAPF